MKNVQTRVSLILLVMLCATLLSKQASAQSTYYYTFGQAFDVSNLSSNTTPLADDSKYTSTGGPLIPLTCDNGIFFCGAKIVIPSGSLSASDRQAVWNAIKAQADANKAALTTPLIPHSPGSPLLVSISGSRTATVTTYLKS